LYIHWQLLSGKSMMSKQKRFWHGFTEQPAQLFWTEL